MRWDFSGFPRFAIMMVTCVCVCVYRFISKLLVSFLKLIYNLIDNKCSRMREMLDFQHEFT